MRLLINSRKIVFIAVLLVMTFDVASGFWWNTAKDEDNEGGNDIDNEDVNNGDDGYLEPIDNRYDYDGGYGVDVSFPMHHAKVSDNYAWLKHNTDPMSYSIPRQLEEKPISPLPDRQDFYDSFLQGCVDHYGKKGFRCVATENDRIAMTLRQPQSMQNYTENGFKKIRAPESLLKLLNYFWEENKNTRSLEEWGAGNTYTNNWNAPTYMVSVENRKLRGGGYNLKQAIWNAAQETLEEWTGQELTQCSLYGIRIYETGAVLAPHVDRLPLVSSAIINVDADLDEPWPLEVIGHDGKAYNVTMEPGDMVLYESHSVIHGRPFPMKGRFVANVFIHFEPTGHTLRHNAANAAPDEDVHEKYRKAVENGVGGHEADDTGLPSYVIPGSPEVPNYRRTHPSGPQKIEKTFGTGSTSALHQAAQRGDARAIKKHLKTHKDVDATDANGWTPLHEASRGGHLEVAKVLLENGADINKGTHGGETALYWAKKYHGEDHPLVEYLLGAGAVEMGPDL